MFTLLEKKSFFNWDLFQELSLLHIGLDVTFVTFGEHAYLAQHCDYTGQTDQGCRFRYHEHRTFPMFHCILCLGAFVITMATHNAA